MKLIRDGVVTRPLIILDELDNFMFDLNKIYDILNKDNVVDYNYDNTKST